MPRRGPYGLSEGMDGLCCCCCHMMSVQLLLVGVSLSQTVLYEIDTLMGLTNWIGLVKQVTFLVFSLKIVLQKPGKERPDTSTDWAYLLQVVSKHFSRGERVGLPSSAGGER